MIHVLNPINFSKKYPIENHSILFLKRIAELSSSSDILYILVELNNS